MEKKENKIELGDLPEDCIVEILNKIRIREHRDNARLVCKLWRRSIDSDSSCERYLVNRWTTGHGGYGFVQPEFRSVIPLFLDFNRNKISFRFVDVDLHDSEYFWTEKGANVIGLYFENWCNRIPLEHILYSCIRLREIFISFSTREIIDVLESLVAREFSNNNLDFLCTTAHITAEMTIQLVDLISRVFPKMKKVNLSMLDAFNWNCEKVTNKFTQLEYELQLNSSRSSVIFDSSSDIPIRVSIVSINNWTLLPYEYFKNLESITYTNGGAAFQLSQLLNLLSQYSILQYLRIICDPLTGELQECVANQLKSLYLLHNGGQLIVNTVFLETFQFLKVFHTRNMSPANLIRILLNMQHLEDLCITNFTTIADEGEIDEEPEVLVHENLKQLTMPSFFSPRTRTNYCFDNLKNITITANGSLSKSEVQNVDDILRLFNCPNLEVIYLEVIIKSPKTIDSLWLKKLMSMFPKLMLYSFYTYFIYGRITEDQELALRQICPELDIPDDKLVSDGVISRDLVLVDI